MWTDDGNGDGMAVWCAGRGAAVVASYVAFDPNTALRSGVDSKAASYHRGHDTMVHCFRDLRPDLPPPAYVAQQFFSVHQS